MNRCVARAIHNSGSLHPTILHYPIRRPQQRPFPVFSRTPSFSSMAFFSPQDPIVVNPRTEHSGTIFMLHGLGDTGAGWKDVARRDVWARNLPHVKFVFPTAPIRPVTVNGGMPGTAWCDVISLRDENAIEDEEGLNQSLNQLQKLVEKEMENGIPSKKIVIAGFSQGGSLALYSLRSKIPFGAVIGMSSFLSMRKKLPLVSEENKKTPVLMCHGTEDNTVIYRYGQVAFEMLKTELEKIEFKSYQMAHTANDQELNDVRLFLESILC
eukprot:g6545.t1